MKKMCKFLTALLMLALLTGLCPTSVFAEEYTYKVTLYAGNQGELNEQAVSVKAGSGSSPEVIYGKDKIVIDKLKAQDRVSFHYQEGVTIKDSEEAGKYYVQGIRRSGRDNDDSTVTELSFAVEEDADYVVAYGIKGDMVGYTIDYVKRGTSEKLIPSRTYYAKSGDKVVVSAPNIDGYVPNAYAQTMTVTSERNHFTFEYREGEVQIVQLPGETITTIVTRPGTAGGTGTGTGTGAGTGTGTGTGTGVGTGTGFGATGEGAGAAGAGAGTAGAGTGAAGEDAGAAEGTTVTDGEEDTTTVEDEEVPQDLVELDDEEAPKANIKLDREEVKKGFPVAAGIAVSVAAVAALAGMIIFLRRHRH